MPVHRGDPGTEGNTMSMLTRSAEADPPGAGLPALRTGRLPPPGGACAATHELRFRSLFDEGRGLAFPCDEKGRVDLDALSPRALSNYCYARAVVGREFHVPAVLPARPH